MSIHKIQQFHSKPCFLGPIKRATPWRNWHYCVYLNCRFILINFPQMHCVLLFLVGDFCLYTATDTKQTSNFCSIFSSESRLSTSRLSGGLLLKLLPSAHLWEKQNVCHMIDILVVYFDFALGLDWIKH